ncbi:MAG: MATE family efflux transporter [Gemmatimonadetes bacterium]|nr:MATE family efflux transporter [Gemmatimonadota bacterium]
MTDSGSPRGLPGAARGLPARARPLRASSRALWAVALPMLVAEVSDPVVGATDTAFLGRFGTIEVGAVGLAVAMYQALIFFGSGLADGLQIITARRAGQRRQHGIGEAFFHGATLLLITSAALFLVLQHGSPYLTRLVVHSAELRAAVDGFLGIMAFAVVFHCLNLAFSGLYVGIGKSGILMWAAGALIATNVVVDYLLIFGNLGFPRLGIRGAAAGSLAGEIAALAFLAIGALSEGDARQFGLFRSRRLDPGLTRAMLGVSWPAGLEKLLQTARWLLLFVIIERTGEMSLAMASVAYGVYGLLLLPIDGFAGGVSAIVSHLIGQGSDARIGEVLRRTAGRATLVLLPLVALALLAPHVPLSLFTSSAEILRGAENSLRVLGVAILVVIPGAMVLNAVAGTGDTRTTLVIEVAASVCVLLYAYVAAIPLGLSQPAVWAAEIVGWLVCLLLSYGWLKRGSWRRLAI